MTTQTRTTRTQVRVTPGERLRVRLPYSEVCMHMRVAGEEMMVELLGDVTADGIGVNNCVQLFNDDGTHFSFPILPSEAGMYRDADGYYTYAVHEDESDE